jgi:hypothetical protein
MVLIVISTTLHLDSGGIGVVACSSATQVQYKAVRPKTQTICTSFSIVVQKSESGIMHWSFSNVS